jgi:uncharacterized membrane protein YfcA
MIATGAFHSMFIQLTKIVVYGSLGVVNFRPATEGLCAGLGAVVAIYATRRGLGRFKDVCFLRLAILVMLISGLSLLWQSRGLFI